MKVSSNAAPSWREYKFAGWVPTTTGHLSFSAIGSDRSSFYYGVHAWNRRLAETTVTGSEVPDVFVCQWRKNNEFGFFRRTLNLLFSRRDPLALNGGNLSSWQIWRDRFFRPHTSQYFIMHAKVADAATPYPPMVPVTSEEDSYPFRNDEHGCLFGEVLQGYRKPGSSNAEWRDFKERFYSMTSLNHDVSGQRDFARKWMEFNYSINNEEKSSFVMQRVSFILFRTGELRVQLPNDKIGEKDSDSGRFASSACRQAYYYIKDIAHRHHHHRADADQGLGLNEVDELDLCWRRETLWDLARAAGKLRREGASLAKRRNASGVAAYAEAFQSNLARHRRAGADFRSILELATYNYAHQRNSIASANDTASFKRQGAATLTIAFLAFTLAFASLYHTASAIRMTAGASAVCVFNNEWRYAPVVLMAIAYLGLFDLFYRHESKLQKWWMDIRNVLVAIARKPSRPWIGLAIALGSLAVGWVLSKSMLGGWDWPIRC